MNKFITGQYPLLQILAMKSLVFRLEESIIFKSEKFGIHEVPIRFVTDLASIPWFVPIKQSSDVSAPAILHDSLYCFQKVDRLTADNLFLEAMEVNGVPKWKRTLFYYTLRAAGWWGWNRATKKKKENDKKN